jgi:hypothetical protein
MFFFLAIACFSVTVFAHAFALRFRPNLSLLTTSLGTSVVASFVFSLGVFVFAAPYFEQSIYAGTCSFFAYQLFFFLGPATADRSLLMLLRSTEQVGMTEADIQAHHLPESFIEKRLEECLDAGLIGRKGERFLLSSRGIFFARVYLLLARIYKLHARDNWYYSFSPERQEIGHH